MLALFVLVPVAGLILLNVPTRVAPSRMAAVTGLALTIAQVVLVILRPAGIFSNTGPLTRYFSFAHDADSLSLVMLLTIGIVLFVTILVAWETMGATRRLFHFVNVLLIAMIGMNGASLVRDLFTLYVFLEITAVASFILIALGQARESLEGALKYIILSAVASALMVSGVALFLLLAGSTDFAAVSAALKGSPGHVYAKIAVAAFLCGLFIKGGLVPFHAWVPGAYATAPAATSVLLAGIGTKISGIYALIRLAVSVFGPLSAMNEVLLFVGAVSIVLGALAALGQRNVKWLLAYSSISQVGYIVLGLGCGTPLALMGAVFHFFNHAILKSLLFVNSASLEDRVGTTDMGRMGGLGAGMPVTSVTSTLAALSTAGVPPLSGFWSKLLIIIALWQAQLYVYAIVAILTSVITLAYMLVMQRRIFFGKAAGELPPAVEPRYGLRVSEIVLAAITVAIGVAIPFTRFALDTLSSVVAGIH